MNIPPSLPQVSSDFKFEKKNEGGSQSVVHTFQMGGVPIQVTMSYKKGEKLTNERILRDMEESIKKITGVYETIGVEQANKPQHVKIDSAGKVFVEGNKIGAFKAELFKKSKKYKNDLDTAKIFKLYKQVVVPDAPAAIKKAAKPAPLSALDAPIQTPASKEQRHYTGDFTPAEQAELNPSYTTHRGQTLTIELPNSTIDFSIRDGQDMLDTNAEVIVNAANTHLGGGGGIDGTIHRKGGPAYAAAHKRLQTVYDSKYVEGHAAMIESGDLATKGPIKNVIVVAGPDPVNKQKTTAAENDNLYSCYYNSLVLADSQGKKSIAFPAISTGIFDFPKDKAASISLKAVSDFVKNNPNTSLQQISIYSGQLKKFTEAIGQGNLF